MPLSKDNLNESVAAISAPPLQGPAEYQCIKLQVINGCAWITQHRPEALNAWNPRLMHELCDAVQRSVDGWPEIRCIVFNGEGRAFSAGGDMKMFESGETRSPWGREVQSLLTATYDTLTAAPQTSIAMIHGHCVGSSFVLTGCCDFRIAATGTKFLLPEIYLGMVPGIGIARLADGVPGHLLKRMVLLGEALETRPLQEAGFLLDVVPESELAESVGALVKKLQGQSAPALELARQVLNNVSSPDRELANQFEFLANINLLEGNGVSEAASQFLKTRANKGELKKTK